MHWEELFRGQSLYLISLKISTAILNFLFTLSIFATYFKKEKKEEQSAHRGMVTVLNLNKCL